jgi:hypothetical protein
VALGGLQHVTHLDLAGGLRLDHETCDAGSLPALGVLPALLELNLRDVQIEGCHWSALGAWLGQQSQLERLSLRSTTQQLADSDPQQQAAGLAQLPTQLVKLDLSSSGLCEWPPRLSQMTGLRVLLVGEGNPHLAPQLPPWLPALQQLEVLDVPVGNTRAVQEEALGLLVQLPQLNELTVAFSKSASVDDQRNAIFDFVSELRVQLPHVLDRTGFWDCSAHASDLFRNDDSAYDDRDQWD